MNQHPTLGHQLLDRLIEAIEDNLQNEQFGVSELAKAAGLSKSQLNRRLHSITGQSASQFIREHRLKKAMELLQGKSATPTEVSYKVGFGSPSYFSTCFKDYYGYSPTKVNYRENWDKARKSTGKWKKNVIIISGAILILTLASILYNIITEDRRITDQSVASVTLAVLPFSFSANDSSKQVHAQFIAGEIANKLSNISELNVIASSFVENMNAREIGNTYNADFLLKISFTIIEESFHLHAEVLSAKDGKMVWSGPYKRHLDDLQDIQSEVAMAVGEQLGAEPTPMEVNQINEKLTQSDAAYQYYLVGNDFLSRLQSEENMRMASNLFNKAVALDSCFARAWIGLYSANKVIYGRYYDRSEDQNKRVQQYFEKARSLDPESLQVKITQSREIEVQDRMVFLKSLLLKYPENDTIYKSISGIHRSLGQIDSALYYVEKAIEFNPTEFHHWIMAGVYHWQSRRYNKAFACYSQALELKPTLKIPHPAFILLDMGELEKAREYLLAGINVSNRFKVGLSHVECLRRDFDKAIFAIKSADSITSNFHSQFRTRSLELGLIYYTMGDMESARIQFQQAQMEMNQKLKELPNDPRALSSLGIAYAGLGMKKNAIDVCKKSISITELEGHEGIGYRIDDLKTIYLLTGNYQDCINLINQELKNGRAHVEPLKLDPLCDPLREMPEFQAMINNPAYAPVL